MNTLESGEVPVNGVVYHYTRRDGKLQKIKSWAYVVEDSLLIFPDAYDSSTCCKVYLGQAKVDVYYENDDDPWIAITDSNDDVFFIQPELLFEFYNWLTSIRHASRYFRGSAHLTSVDHGDFTANSSKTLPDSVRLLTPKTKTESLSRFLFSASRNEPAEMSGDLVGSRSSEEIRPISSQPVQLDEVDRPPAVPKRISRPWDRQPERVQEPPNVTRTKSSQPYRYGQNSPRFNGNVRSSVVHTDSRDSEVQPPIPPRRSAPLHTVKEHPALRDDEVLVTKPLADLRSRYPVSGLAKRMSISASDLLGKSRDELILLLLQLNREKANLQRWHGYFMQQMEFIRMEGNDTNVQQKLASIQMELEDVSGQLSLSEPLVKFLRNMLRMADLYGGDDVMFASEYRKHLLSEREVVPPKPSLDFAREVETREVAQVLNERRRERSNTGASTSPNAFSDRTGALASWIAQPEASGLAASSRIPTPVSTHWPETANNLRRRARLEAELASLEALCESHQSIHKELRDTQKSLTNLESRDLMDYKGPQPRNLGPSAALLRRLKSGESAFSRRFSMDESEAANGYPPYNESSLHNSRKRGSAFSMQSARGSIDRPRSCYSSADANWPTYFSGSSSTRQNPTMIHFRSIPDHLNLLSMDVRSSCPERPWDDCWLGTTDIRTSFNPIRDRPRTFTPVRPQPQRPINRSTELIDRQSVDVTNFTRGTDSPLYRDPRRKRGSSPACPGRHSMAELDYPQTPKSLSRTFDPTRQYAPRYPIYEQHRESGSAAATKENYPASPYTQRSSTHFGEDPCDTTENYSPMETLRTRRYLPLRKSTQSQRRQYDSESTMTDLAKESESLHQQSSNNFPRHSNGRSYYDEEYHQELLGESCLPSSGIKQTGNDKKRFGEHQEQIFQTRVMEDRKKANGGMGRQKNSFLITAPIYHGCISNDRIQKDSTDSHAEAYSDDRLTPDSIDRMLKPPKPMPIPQRYVPSPPAQDPLDPAHKRERDLRLSAIRDMLLRQRIGISMRVDQEVPTESSPADVNEVFEQRAQVLTIQATLAKEAAASASSFAANWLQRGDAPHA